MGEYKILCMDIKFEVYLKDSAVKWANDNELYVLEVVDIISYKPIMSYNDYKKEIETIFKNDCISQNNIKGINLEELEMEKLYSGHFEWHDDRLSCTNYKIEEG